MTGPELVDKLRSQTPSMLEMLEQFVSVESPSSETAATARCADLIASTGEKFLGEKPEILTNIGRSHVRWRFGEQPKVMLLGHFDTVWSLGTIERWPFSVDGTRATGPGIFDMKAGIVQGLFAVKNLPDPSGVEILLVSDEEIGSRSSRELIREDARRVEAVLVLEPGTKDAIKIARKGVAGFVIGIDGRAAHAGLEPEKGASALMAMAHLLPRVAALADPKEGTTVTPTTATAGTTRNTVPARAEFTVDVRAWTSEEQQRVDDALEALVPPTEGTKVTVVSKGTRPPLEASSSKELFELAKKIAADLGLGELAGAEVGGASDGNLTAALGIPTLDGLGAVGGGAHAEGEYVMVPAMAERAALVAALTRKLLGD